MTPKTRHDDRGETLVEIVITLMVLSVAVVALIGGLVTAVMVSDTHRKQAKAGVYVRAFAEALENKVAGSPTAYANCATTTTYASAYSNSDVDFVAEVTAIGYWNDTTLTWVSTCTTDGGVQRVSLRVRSTDGRANETLDLIIRKPCRSRTDYPADAAC